MKDIIDKEDYFEPACPFCTDAYQKEPPIKSESGERVPGSVSFVPSVAGLIIAGEVIKDLIRSDGDNNE